MNNSGDLRAEARRSDIGNADRDRHFRKSLRNLRINYRNGWFFVTCQVAHNKCVLGAIAQNRCILTPLGEAVRDYWLAIPRKHPEVELDEFAVMPNHFHAILRIHYRATNKPHHLGYIMSRFKGGTGYIYGKMLDEGRAPAIGRIGRAEARPSDIAASVPVSGRPASAGATGAGECTHLWQRDYWDDLITSERELENQRRYIRENPARWSRDRFGPCTQYHYGSLDLLNAPRIAFVASQGFSAAALRPRLFRRFGPAKAGPSDTDKEAGPSDTGKEAGRSGTGQEAGTSDTGMATSEGAASAAPNRQEAVIISTFTSAQEREALRRALAKGRRVIAVMPAGIGPAKAGTFDTGKEAGRSNIGEAGFSPLLAAAREGRALLLSPQPPGSSLTKKAATWCNEYVLAHAHEIWTGDISEGGMLHALLQSAAEIPDLKARV